MLPSCPSGCARVEHEIDADKRAKRASFPHCGNTSPGLGDDVRNNMPLLAPSPGSQDEARVCRHPGSVTARIRVGCICTPSKSAVFSAAIPIICPGKPTVCVRLRVGVHHRGRAFVSSVPPKTLVVKLPPPSSSLPIYRAVPPQTHTTANLQQPIRSRGCFID